jgi:hypothetical protein
MKRSTLVALGVVAALGVAAVAVPVVARQTMGHMHSMQGMQGGMEDGGMMQGGMQGHMAGQHGGMHMQDGGGMQDGMGRGMQDGKGMMEAN